MGSSLICFLTRRNRGKRDHLQKYYRKFYRLIGMVPKSTGTCLPKMNRRSSLTLAEAPEKSLNSTFLIHPRLSSYLLGSERKEVCFRSTLDFFFPHSLIPSKKSRRQSPAKMREGKEGQQCQRWQRLYLLRSEPWCHLGWAGWQRRNG